MSSLSIKSCVVFLEGVAAEMSESFLGSISVALRNGFSNAEKFNDIFTDSLKNEASPAASFCRPGVAAIIELSKLEGQLGEFCPLFNLVILLFSSLLSVFSLIFRSETS